MVFMHGIAGHSAAYHVCFGVELSGSLDVARLERVLRELPSAFGQLQMRFVSLSDGVSCLPARKAQMPVRLHRGSIRDSSRLMEIATEFANAPFDIEAGDTARVLVIEADPQLRHLVFVFHHVVMDAWGFELLLADVARRYAQSEVADSLPVVAQPDYAAYAQWHRRWFREHAFEKDLGFWKQMLQGSERSTIEPDFSRKPAREFRGDRVGWRPEAALWEAVGDRAREANVTVACWFLATFVYWMRTHAISADVTIGLAVANRHHIGSDEVVGSLVNLLPLRIAVDTTWDFRSFVQAVQARLLECLDHQDMPFEVLVRQLRLERTASESPLIGVLFNMLNLPTTTESIGSAAVRRYDVDRKASQFDLTLTIDDRHERVFWFEYSTDLYSRRTIELAAGRFATLLQASIAQPSVLLSSLPMCSAEETALMDTWGSGELKALPGVGLAVWMVRQLDRHRDRVAVVDEQVVLDYSDVAQLSGRFSAGLRSLGYSPGDRIGLMLDRSSEALIAIVGCLRAGVAFVPLDPGFPPERNAHVVADAGLACIVTASSLPDSVARAAGSVRWMSVPEVASHPARGIDHVDPEGRTPAYVLYTSGSTGRPKGVVITQRALLNLLVGMSQRPGIAPDATLLAVTTWGFDIALLEILLPLVNGARVVIASREQVLDGQQLSRLIDAFQVDVLQATPATWIQLLESGWKGSKTLRAFVGGEALAADLARRLSERTAEIWNMYGPTETTIWSTCRRIEGVAGAAAPLGSPIINTGIRILTPDGRAVGVSTPGEIVISGEGVAQGYLGMPDLTADRFRIDGSRRGSVYYRTGDIGRWTAEGELEFRGRVDRQIKLRGFRIEPGEIESVATAVSGVERAVLVMEGAGSAGARLVLHVQSTSDRDGLLTILRGEMGLRLADYMVPKVIHMHERLPLLPNGKLDMKALPAGPAMPRDDATAAPRDDLERQLARIWEELLGMRSIGRDADFFECGGHSLLAMRLVARIREDLGRQCTLQQIFQGATLAQLSERLRGSEARRAGRVVTLRAEGEGTPLFCICGVLIYRQLTQCLPEGFPVRAVYVPLDREHSDVVGLARQYVREIRESQPAGPYNLLGFSFGGMLAFEIARQLEAVGERVKNCVLLDSDAPGRSPIGGMQEIWRGLRAALTGDESARASVPDYVRAMRIYRATPVSCPVLLVRATKAQEQVAEQAWSGLAGSYASVSVEAGHLEMLQDDAAAAVAGLVGNRLVIHA